MAIPEATSVVRAAIPKIGTGLHMPPDVPENSSLDAPVWRCRQQQSRGCYCLSLPWPGPAGALLGRGSENDCFHPGIRLPGLLSAQPWELLRTLGWARGAHEQCANSALFALSQPSCLLAPPTAPSGLCCRTVYCYGCSNPGPLPFGRFLGW